MRVLIVFLLGMVMSRGDVLPEGGGFMYNDKYWFAMKAPKGWVLDNETVKDKSVCAVFYPVESNWADATAVMYVNTRERKGTAAAAMAAVIKTDVDDMHANGSPKMKAEKLKEIKLARGRVALVWEYSGDKWGNIERTTFVVEEEGINAVVLTARTKAEADGAMAAFEELIKSYEYLGRVEIKK